MRSGEVVEEGSVKQILTNPKNDYTKKTYKFSFYLAYKNSISFESAIIAIASPPSYFEYLPDFIQAIKSMYPWDIF